MWHPAFAIGVLRDIYAFHRYTTSSECLRRTQEGQFQPRDPVEQGHLTADLSLPPALPLNPINPDNALTFRITAAAGTELAGHYSPGTCNTPLVAHVIPGQKRFTTRRAFLPHATWLVQARAH